MTKTPTDIEKIVEHYNLQPHPEGGFFAETYRSNLKIETPQGKRSASTAIVFLITKDSISHFHKLTSDEGWHFYEGAPLRLFQINREGELIETTIGPDTSQGQRFQHIVPAGDWFASTSFGDYSLVGCTVAPGFDFKDFEMGKREELLKEFPQHSEVLSEFCLE
ncbi:MAG: cupin domain-containing protein [Halobacteriovoraceae bacterium]|nr:cupin domain-containing protein [Halobacteriovoraceae bacterium]